MFKAINKKPSFKWGYNKNNGPNYWLDMCSSGIHQSPINIRSSDIYYINMEKLNFVNYNKFDSVFVKNTGHGSFFFLNLI